MDKEEITWLLDVDGVVNATRPGWGAAPRQGSLYCDGLAWKFRWSEKLIYHIKEIEKSGVTIKWSSSWWAEISQLNRLFKVNWPTAIRKPEEIMKAKLEAALAELAAGRKLIWTDDDIDPNLAKRLGSRALLISPDERFGLQPPHILQIRKFVGMVSVDGNQPAG